METSSRSTSTLTERRLPDTRIAFRKHSVVMFVNGEFLVRQTLGLGQLAFAMS
jgi:hypothetical protein